MPLSERHESKVAYKQRTRGAKRRAEARPKENEKGRQSREEGDGLAQLSAHKATEG